MSCKECEEAQDQSPGFYYRVENANVQIKGCRKHVAKLLEMIDGRKRLPEEIVKSP